MCDVVVEFPRLNEKLAGAPHRFCYGLEMDPMTDPGPPAFTQRLFKVDTREGNAEVLEMSADTHPGEPVLAASRDGAENEGWVLTLSHDTASGKGELLVIDARDFSASPVARVKLPVRVPKGFRGGWVAGEAFVSEG